MLRFIQNAKLTKADRATTKIVTPSELTTALHLITRTVQAADFKDDIIKLKAKKEVTSSSSISSLSPFLDENDVLRVGGRLEASHLSFNAKHPIL